MATFIVSGFDVKSLTASKLSPILPAAAEAAYDENWVQTIVDRYPDVLPIAEIDPIFEDPMSICCELPTPAGYVDNVLINRQGFITLVECKLYKNHEARREVLAQLLNYARAVTRLGFEQFDRQVRQVRTDKRGIVELLAPEGVADGLDTSALVDRIAENLRLGRFLLLIVGDGIRRELQELADFVANDLGRHYTLAIVRLALFSDGESHRVVVVPDVLARTVQIERAVVRVETADISVSPYRPEETKATAKRTITDEVFDEALATLNPAWPGQLHRFFAACEERGLYVQANAASKGIYADTEKKAGISLGLVYRDGKLDFSSVAATTSASEKLDVGRTYLLRIADLVGGTLKENPDNLWGWSIKKNGKPLMIGDALAVVDSWLSLIDQTVKALRNQTAAD